MKIEMNNDRAWLEQLATRDTYRVVSAGGWAARSLEHGSTPDGLRPPRVFGQLIEYARRERGLTLSILAQLADVELSELVAIERDPQAIAEPRTVQRLADVLQLPSVKLMALAGLIEPRDRALTEAAVRFAARTEPFTKLSADEKDALDEFVRVLSVQQTEA